MRRTTLRAVWVRLIPVLVGVIGYVASDWLLSHWSVLSGPEVQLSDELLTRLPKIPANPSIVLVTIQESSQSYVSAETLSVGFPRRAYAGLLAAVMAKRPAVVVLDIDLTGLTSNEARLFDEAVRKDVSVPVVVPTVPAVQRDTQGNEEPVVVEDPSAVGGLRISYAGLGLRASPNLYVGSAENYPGEVSTGVVPFRTDFATRSPILHVTALAAALFSHADLSRVQLAADRTWLRIGHLEWELGGDQDVSSRSTTTATAFPEVPYEVAMGMRESEGTPSLQGKIVLIGDVRPGIDRHETPPFGSQPGLRFLAQMVNTFLMPARYAVRWSPDWAQAFVAACFAIASAYACLASRKWLRLIFPIGLAVAGWLVPIALIQGSSLRFDPLILPVGVALTSVACWIYLALRSGLVDLRRAGDVQIATVLFVDVRGSTELTREIGGRAVQKVVNGFVSAAEKDVMAVGGQVERSTGDGFVAVFPNVSRDNSVLACLRLVPRLVRHAEAASQELGRPFQIKMGLENGPVTGGYVPEQGRRSWSTAGNTINFAARLLDACSLWNVSVAIGPVAAAMLGEDVQVVRLGEFVAKGFDAKVTVYTIGTEDT